MTIIASWTSVFMRVMDGKGEVFPRASWSRLSEGRAAMTGGAEDRFAAHKGSAVSAVMFLQDVIEGGGDALSRRVALGTVDLIGGGDRALGRGQYRSG